MKPEHRFHSYVTAATVTVMFLAIQHLTPLLGSPSESLTLLAPVGGLLVSVGVYKLLATLLQAAARRIKLVKRHLLGANYLNGTWVGRFRTRDGEPIYTVEHFEQTLSSLQVRGQAFRESGESYAYWNSTSETIDEKAGLLTYTYHCDRNDDRSSFQGVCVLQLERADESSPAIRMRGYSADLVDGVRTENREAKVTEDLIDFEDGLKRAKNLLR